MSELTGQRGFVTGGGRGIGESVARELAAAGMDVAVSGRTAEQVEGVAAAIGGQALVGDVSRPEVVERWFTESGPVDLLVANAGTGTHHDDTEWEFDLEKWWRTFEVNVLGVHLCCRAVIPGMLERGSGRIVIVGSGSAYLPGQSETAYTSSKAAVCRYGETLANALGDRIPVFVISPGMVRTEMTASFPDDLPWTPPECAPRLVRALASGEFDALSGRYLHAEHDPPESLRGRIDEVIEHDWNAIRLRRP
ncbi:MAG: SDR family oxidoreductase [Actinobacteria bacterium]|nr:MAG: SDR family oxidoreductase [Actinomycetota bacterium]